MTMLKSLKCCLGGHGWLSSAGLWSSPILWSWPMVGLCGGVKRSAFNGGMVPGGAGWFWSSRRFNIVCRV